jgi:hypothetical protein
VKRRRWMRRRLVWAGVLLGLVLLLASVSVVRAALWTRDAIDARTWRQSGSAA